MLYTVHFTAFSLGGRFFRTRKTYFTNVLTFPSAPLFRLAVWVPFGLGVIVPAYSLSLTLTSPVVAMYWPCSLLLRHRTLAPVHSLWRVPRPGIQLPMHIRARETV